MNITEQVAQVLQEIDEQLAICEKATAGPWTNGTVTVFAPNYSVATCDSENEEKDAAFIAASRTVCPTALRWIKTAIYTLAAQAEVDTKLRGFTESAAINALTTLINQWNSK